MKETETKTWYVYILLCSDNTLYTGVTTDLEKRLAQHKSGKGSRYTRAHGAEEFLYYYRHASHSSALKQEYEIKKLSKHGKLALVASIENENALR